MSADKTEKRANKKCKLKTAPGNTGKTSAPIGAWECNFRLFRKL